MELINFLMNNADIIEDDIDNEDEPSNQWLKTSDDVYSACRDNTIVKEMDSGIYEVFQDNQGKVFAAKITPNTDELFHLPNNHINEVVTEISDFWTKADKFKEHKMKHKRGVMLYGPPGTGKTSIINLLSASLIEQGGLVFSVGNTSEFFWFKQFAHNSLREVEPTRNVIVIIEDIDKYMDGAGVESELLNMLDGEGSLDHVVVVATTNRFEDLNDLLLRPSRFDHHVLIDKPEIEVREAYLLKKGIDKATAKKWAKDTDGYSLAELKELFVSVVLLDLDYEKAKAKVNDQANNVTNTTFVAPKGKKKGVGFKIG